NLGHAYKNLDGIRDLALSEQWYRRSLDARAKEDRMGRAKCLAQLGSVARRRFGDAREANRSREVCLSHLATAERSYLGALGMFPANAVRERDAVHNQLGNIYRDAGQVDTALHHFRESVRYCEARQDRFGAGQTRENAALALIDASRFA